MNRTRPFVTLLIALWIGTTHAPGTAYATQRVQRPVPPDRTAIRAALEGAQRCARARRLAWQRGEYSRPHRSLASPNIDATSYALHITIDFAATRIDGVVCAVARVVNQPLSVLALDLSDSMVVSGVRIPGGTNLPWTHAGNVLSITLPSPVPVDSSVAVEVTYGGTPVVSGFGTFVFGTRSGQPYAWSLSEPYGARDWWPCRDHPSDKADSIRVRITVPDGFTAVSQGPLNSSTSSGGWTTWDWSSHYPITTYLVSIAAGRYAHFRTSYVRPGSLAVEFGPLTLPIEHYVYDDGSPTTLPKEWARISDAFPVFEEYFGPYPFAREKYGHAQFTFLGGMEHQTISSIGFTATSVMVHELAHQWYGDMISPASWRHVWLNEGFATYAELLYWEARRDSFPGFFDIILSARRAGARRAPGTLVLADTTSVPNMFDGTRVYAKGAYVLHMLRKSIGDSLFTQVMRGWSASSAVHYGTATTSDFRGVVEQVTGRSFARFFSQWVTQGTGYPVYRVSLDTQRRAAGWTAYVTVEQTQTMPLSNVDVFEMPVTLAITTRLNDTTTVEQRFRVTDSRRYQVFALRTTSEPIRVALDPDGDLLRNENTLSSSVPVPSALRVDNVFPNPTRTSAEIHFQLPSAGTVDMFVYDGRGRLVRQRSYSAMPSGPNRIVFDGRALARGMYFVRIRSHAGAVSRKITLVR